VTRRRPAASLLLALALVFGGSCSKRSSEPVVKPLPAAPAAPSIPSAATTAKVRAIASEILEMPVAKISDDVPLAELPNPADELAVVELVLALEERFSIEIADQELEAAPGNAAPADIARSLSVRKLAEIVERHRTPAPVAAPRPKSVTPR
jgi:acyl carrier protein